MMHSKEGRLAWWQLYLLGLVMIGLLVLEAKAPLPEAGHTAAAVGTLLLVYRLVALWLRANKVALMRANELAARLREAGEKVGREEAGRDQLPLCVPWTLSSEMGIIGGDNGDREPGRTVEAILTLAEREEE
jgi:hypothetical protein